MRVTIPLLAMIIILSGCARVDGTGRSQFILTTPAQEAAMGEEAFTEVMAKSSIESGTVNATMIERVGQRLAKACGASGFEWQFRLLKDPTVNAFCLPGGKVVFYGGILPYCQDEAGVAVVMGHEIAHAVARHGGERMSQGVLISGATMAIEAALTQKGVQPTQKNLWLAAIGAGGQLGVLLPFSRKHEYEADYLGLTYMAKAGYDPAAAPEFWERFSQQGGEKPPEFLSTHPCDDKRAAELRRRLTEAQALYQQAALKYGRGATIGR